MAQQFYPVRTILFYYLKNNDTYGKAVKFHSKHLNQLFVSHAQGARSARHCCHTIPQLKVGNHFTNVLNIKSHDKSFGGGRVDSSQTRKRMTQESQCNQKKTWWKNSRRT
jgi:hypothetical protein